MNVLGFKEVIQDGDGYYYEGEIWFIGELNERKRTSIFSDEE